MLQCYFCGSNIETQKDDPFFKDKKISTDRYFVDKEDGKKMCRLCAEHYMKRQYLDKFGWEEEIDIDKFLEFITGRFEKIMLKRERGLRLAPSTRTLENG